MKNLFKVGEEKIKRILQGAGIIVIAILIGLLIPVLNKCSHKVPDNSGLVNEAELRQHLLDSTLIEENKRLDSISDAKIIKYEKEIMQSQIEAKKWEKKYNEAKEAYFSDTTNQTPACTDAIEAADSTIAEKNKQLNKFNKITVEQSGKLDKKDNTIRVLTMDYKTCETENKQKDIIIANCNKKNWIQRNKFWLGFGSAILAETAAIYYGNKLLK